MLKRILPALLAYGFAVASVATSSAIAFFVHPYAVIGDLAMIELLGVVAVAMRQSVRVSLFAALLSNFSLAFLFVPPRFHLSLSDIERGVIYVAMIVVAVVISALNERLRKEEQLARAAAFRAEALYALNHELSTATDTRQLVAVTTRHVERLLTAEHVTVLLGAPEGWAADAVSSGDRIQAERAWVRRDFTATRDQTPAAVWIPLSGSHSPLGVIGVGVPESFGPDSPEGFLLSACGSQLGTALERVQLAQVVHRTELEAEAERLKSSLLSAVSHDLKTPVAAIIAAGTTLLERKKLLDTEGERALLSSIVSEGERLTRLIQNLLSVIRLDSPTVELNRTPESIEEIVAATVDRFEGLLDGSHVTVDLEPDLPLVSAEPLLLQQVLINLLENAARYAGSGTHLWIHAGAAEDAVAVRVSDDGPGIPVDEREKVFEKFYRGRFSGKQDGGVGLGLTICRAIVRAHGGRIHVRERDGGGTLVEFTVPVAQLPERPSSEAPLLLS